MQGETLQQMVARLNASGFLHEDPTAGDRRVATKVKMSRGKEFHFPEAREGRGGGALKYPWEEWFNGDLLLLERSSGKENDKRTIVEVVEKKDYEVPTDAMPPKIKTAARRRYKVVQISRVDADGNRLDNALIIRARDMTPEERAAEDLLRAEEKAARKEAADNNGDDNGSTPAVEPPAPQV